MILKRKIWILSIFNSDIIEFVGIDKVYNASVFGDFAGGNININTKNYSGAGFFSVRKFQMALIRMRYQKIPFTFRMDRINWG
jgi:hypothetical protein